MILHVDMDAFYVSVEERDNPELKGKPVVVGGSPTGRGVVTAANYEARKFGLHSAMSAAQALRLCPQVIMLRPRMDHYVDISRRIREIFERYTPDIEPLSLDEAFLNVEGSQRLFGTAEDIGRRVKEEIRSELQLVASVGVAPNKFLAKLASDLEKPDGFTVIPPDRVQEILDPLSIARIWGVGKVTQRRFEANGITTFGQLRQLSKSQVQHLFGRSGEHFWRLAQGLDSRRVVSERSARTISHEHTFAADIESMEILQAWLMDLTEQVAMRLRSGDYYGKTVQIKVRYSDFHTITRAHTLERPSQSTNELWQAASSLLRNRLPKRRLRVRLLGVGVSNIDHAQPVQLRLFDDEGRSNAQHLDTATDKVRKQFGKGAVQRASTLLRPQRDKSERQGDE